MYSISYDSIMDWSVDKLAGQEPHKPWVTMVELWAKGSVRIGGVTGGTLELMEYHGGEVCD